MTPRQLAELCATHRDSLAAIVKRHPQLPKSDRAAITDAVIDLDRIAKHQLAHAPAAPQPPPLPSET